MPEVEWSAEHRDSLVSVTSEIRRRARTGELSGSLQVAGDPGGQFHFRTGAVVEVSSPGAPGVETLLLHSGRVSESDWSTALRAGEAGDRAGAELVARGLVGPAELQLVCLMAALDAALAIGMGRIDGFSFDPGAPFQHLAAPEGIDADWLLQEAERRIGVLASLAAPHAPFHSRPLRTVTGTALLDGPANPDGSPVNGDRREILVRVNGRRSARDIAFLLGRSLYAVTVEMARMHGEGLVRSAGAPGAPGTLRPIGTADELGRPFGSPGTGAPPLAAGPRPDRPALPLRQRGASRITELFPLRPISDRLP
ncbi:MarR family transcriptional regulator [Kitasatospora sp. A2-31]|uniref:MarR family transcriptional regulator n=1 Tax=Kitasatospora sp. A2-31 TaxID=2916414 RepID=UPI001EE85F91|nr:MarR family transcriptional regulator [Kitasatospora sp. A2-31]MCG6493726.1 MarR family transcriptional regulator [Kitasatospora sp. A2-31]